MDWIVVPSAVHTLFLPGVLARYPDAKIVGPQVAQSKLNVIGALPRGKFDYDSTSTSDMSSANALLESKGVRLFNVDGDVGTRSLVAIIEEFELLCCDLIFTHADGEGFLGIDRQRFREFLREDWFERVLRYVTMAKPNSPNGFLPAFKFHLMDPNSFGAIIYDPPAPDGSTCVVMANCLRKLATERFHYANGVHFDRMEREVFLSAMEKNWNWLDGLPLIGKDLFETLCL